MNPLDLIVCLALAVAVWRGWRSGVIVQVCSLAGLLVALWLAARYGGQAGRWLRLDETDAAAGGFVAVFVAGLLAAGVAARLLRGVVRFAGLGLLDRVLGVAVSAAKWLLALGALFAALDDLNGEYRLVSPATIEESKTFRPVGDFASRLFPRLRAWGEAAVSADADEEPKTA